MAHSRNLLARIYDEINRDGFEWLMKPVANYRLYLKKYENQSPRMRFMRRFALSLLTLPVISLAYVFTRTTGVILNPLQWRDNPLKPFMMGFLAGAAIAMPMMALGTKTFLGLVTFGIPGVGGALLALSLLATMTAGILYGAKMLVRSLDDSIDNEGLLIQAKGLSAKHRLSFGKGLEDFPSAYLSILEDHKKIKDSQPQTRKEIIQQARAIKKGKQLIADFEEGIEAHQAGTLTQEQFEKILPTRRPVLFSDTRYGSAFENKEVVQGKIVLKHTKSQF